MQTSNASSRSTARISLDPPRTLLNRFAHAFTKRQYGMAMEPLLALGHHSRVLRSLIRFEQGIARWDSVDEELKHLANAAVAGRISRFRETTREERIEAIDPTLVPRDVERKRERREKSA